MSVNEKMTAIANAIRNYSDLTGKLNLDDMAREIPNVHQYGYDSGKVIGRYEGLEEGFGQGYGRGLEEGLEQMVFEKLSKYKKLTLMSL